MRQISQRELRNDSAAVLRAVEAGESLEVTRRGRPVARLVPLDAASSGVRPARLPAVFDLDEMVTWAEPTGVVLDELRADR